MRFETERKLQISGHVVVASEEGLRIGVVVDVERVVGLAVAIGSGGCRLEERVLNGEMKEVVRDRLYCL